MNVSSVGGEIALPLDCWYYATKHALEAYCDTLRMEVGPFGIIKTDFEDRTAQDLRETSGTTAYGEMAGDPRADHGGR